MEEGTRIVPSGYRAECSVSFVADNRKDALVGLRLALRAEVAKIEEALAEPEATP